MDCIYVAFSQTQLFIFPHIHPFIHRRQPCKELSSLSGAAGVVNTLRTFSTLVFTASNAFNAWFTDLLNITSTTLCTKQMIPSGSCHVESALAGVLMSGPSQTVTQCKCKPKGVYNPLSM